MDKPVTNSANKKTIIFLCIALLFFIIFRRSWVSDDAYITLRTVDNFVNGYGLTWNITERVQAYTHPLWMFLLSFFYFFTREPFYTTIFVSMGISILSLYFVLRYFGKNHLQIFLALIVFGLSRAYVDYSTSGLENPLSHLILALFFVLYLIQFSNINEKSLFYVSLIASLGILNRADLVLVFAPPLFYYLWSYRKWKGLLYVLLGQIPLILWEVFSLIYYGYLVPNTAFAKLPYGISRIVILKQGITYFYHSIINDPITMMIILLGISLPFIQNKNKKLLSVSIGVLLYLGYILWIGGDFMSGRFFTVPLFCALLSILVISTKYRTEIIYSLIAIGLILGFSIPFHTLTLNVEEIQFADNGVNDERLYFFPGMNLITRYRNHMQPEFKWKTQGKDFRERGIKVTHARAIGMFGYYAGPNVYIIDGHALADPLLSKLPVANTVANSSIYSSGHILRELPGGYIESLKSGINEIKDPNISQYYEKIKIITQGNLFDSERLKVIWEMNIGKYDYLINKQ